MKRDSHTLDLEFPRELIIDNFAGGGGTSTGLEQAFGRPVDIAINHDPEALAMHAINHPHTQHLCESVWNVDPIEVTKNQPVGLVWLSPDCFPAGTLVMTDKGYRAIESIRVGDQVLTHKLRWRAVTECSSTVRPLIEIRGHGHPGLRVSPEHPFYTREQFRAWNNNRRSYDYALKAPEWTPASAVQRGLYWGSPCTFPESVAPDVAGRGINMSNELLWLAGRYVGDGWTRLTDTRAELVITCGNHEVDRLRVLLNRWPRAGGRAIANELEWHERHTSTAYQFSTDHRGLVEWLRGHFGHRAEAKGIPAWALGLPAAARESILEGYLSADGHKFDSFVEAHTVSKSLAFGLKALASSLGKTVTVYCRPNSSVIQGRKVNARDLFKVRWRHAVHAEHVQTYVEGGIEWCPVREQSAACGSAEVFNIGVEEDESYVVEGVLVHNCKHFSKAKGGTPVAKNIRGLAWIGLRWVARTKPRVMILENVEEFQTWGPLLVDADGNTRPDPARKGKTFESFVRQLRAHGYEVQWRVLRACDNGAPTSRKRLFLVARRDGIPITWPDQTHGSPTHAGVLAGQLLPWATAAQCIDFHLPSASVFGRKKDLALNTQRRIAKGLWRHVLTSARPYIVNTDADSPVYEKPSMSTAPFLSEHANASNQRDMAVNEPMRTICAQVKGGHFSVVAPTLVTMRGTSESGLSNVQSAQQPLSAISAGGNHHALVAGHITKFNTGAIGYGPSEPMATITAGGTPKRPSTGCTQGQVGARLVTALAAGAAPLSEDRGSEVESPLNAQDKSFFSAMREFDERVEEAVVDTATLASHLITIGYGERAGQAPRIHTLDQPLGTVVASGAKHGVVAAHLVDMGHGESTAAGAKRWSHGVRALDTPLNTITASGGTSALSAIHLAPLPVQAGAGHDMVAACLEQAYGGFYDGDGRPVDAPMSTVTATGSQQRLISAYYVKYYSGGGQDGSVKAPMHTVPTKGGMGLAQVIQVSRDCLAPEHQEKARQCALLLHTHLPEYFPELADMVLVGEYVLVDITLRMLKPHELFVAQGFPGETIFHEIPDPERLFIDGKQVAGDPRLLPRVKLTARAQIRMCGNSVSPMQAKALALANFQHENQIYRQQAE